MTTIAWTDKTWNPATGCSKVSPGCAHCYAETMAGRLKAMGQHAYRNGFEVTLQPQALDRPLGWRKPCMVFVNSMSDLFHEQIPEEYIWRVWAVMAACPQHRFQVLTKRPERMAEVLGGPAAKVLFECAVEARGGADLLDMPAYPLPNVWLGTSIENARFCSRLGHLYRTPAAIRFVSFEPLLGPVADEMRGVMAPPLGTNLPGLDWAIIGGESGPGARRMDPKWALDLVETLSLGRARIFVKQLGSVLGAECGINNKAEDPTLWPDHLAALRRREFPA